MTNSEAHLNQLVNDLAQAGHQEIQVIKLKTQGPRKDQLLTPKRPKATRQPYIA